MSKILCAPRWYLNDWKRERTSSSCSLDFARFSGLAVTAVPCWACECTSLYAVAMQTLVLQKKNRPNAKNLMCTTLISKWLQSLTHKFKLFAWLREVFGFGSDCSAIFGLRRHEFVYSDIADTSITKNKDSGKWTTYCVHHVDDQIANAQAWAARLTSRGFRFWQWLLSHLRPANG